MTPERGGKRGRFRGAGTLGSGCEIDSARCRGFNGWRRDGLGPVFKLTSQRFHGGKLVNVEHGKRLEPGTLPQFRNHPRREERVASEIEKEIVIDRNWRAIEE